MSRLESIGDALWDQLRHGVKDARQAYAGANYWARMRLWVFAVLALDVVLTVVAVVAFSGGPKVEAWFEPGFPSDMIIVRNLEDTPLREVEIIIDRRYRLRIREIPKAGTTGFDLHREFEDGDGLAPDQDYVPRRVTVIHTGGRREISLD